MTLLSAPADDHFEPEDKGAYQRVTIHGTNLTGEEVIEEGWVPTATATIIEPIVCPDCGAILGEARWSADRNTCFKVFTAWPPKCPHAPWPPRLPRRPRHQDRLGDLVVHL